MFAHMQNTATKSGRRARRSRAEWVAEVEQWRNSGLGSAQYAAQHGLKRGTLLWWSRQVETVADERPQAQGAAARVSFVPVRMRQTSPEAKAPAHATGSVEVILSNGRRVRVVGEVDKADLARVLVAAEGGDEC